MSLRDNSTIQGFSEWLSKADQALVLEVRKSTGIDISDHRPENLQVIDRSLGPRFRERVRQNEEDYERSAIAIGSFLGEVLIRNAGGRWHFPNYFQTLVVLLLGNPFRTEKYWYVLLGDRRVPVFRAAREAIDKTSGGFSLYDFYLQWTRIKSAKESTSF